MTEDSRGWPGKASNSEGRWGAVRDSRVAHE